MRQTRASSQNPSSRGVSPSGSELPYTPKSKSTPARATSSAKKPKARKDEASKGKKNLPTVTGGTSTSYGNERLEGPRELTNEAGGGIDNALSNLGVNLSQQNGLPVIVEGEEGISYGDSYEREPTFTAAGELDHDQNVDSTIYSQVSGLTRREDGFWRTEREEAEAPKHEAVARMNKNRTHRVMPTIEERATQRNEAGQIPLAATNGEGTESSFLQARRMALNQFHPMVRLLKRYWATLVLLCIALYAGMFLGAVGTHYQKDLAFSNSTSDGNAPRYRWYGWDVTHNFGQLVHPVLTHPVTYIQSNENARLLHDMKDLKLEVAHLQHRHDMSAYTLSEFKYALPHVLLVGRNEDGSLKLPESFWVAVRTRLEEDKSLGSAIDFMITTANQIANGTVIGERVTKILNERVTSSEFYEFFMERNQASVDRYVKLKAQNLVTDGVLLGPDQVIELMQRESAESRKETDKRVAAIAEQAEEALRKIENLIGDPALHEVIERISRQIALETYQSAHLQALASTRVDAAMHRSLGRVDFFSPETGARINERLTDSSYMPKDLQDHGWFSWIYELTGGVKRVSPLPPQTALEDWTRWGQCWPLSLEAYSRGKGLAVKTRLPVIPDEVVVENILDAESLTPGNGPRNMELLVRYDDPDVHQEMMSASEKYLGVVEPLPDSLRRNWVPVSRFRFDAKSSAYAQAFRVDLPLNSLARDGVKVSSSKFMIRVEDNWSNDEDSYTCLYRVRLHGEHEGQRPNLL